MIQFCSAAKTSLSTHHEGTLSSNDRSLFNRAISKPRVTLKTQGHPREVGRTFSVFSGFLKEVIPYGRNGEKIHCMVFHVMLGVSCP